MLPTVAYDTNVVQVLLVGFDVPPEGSTWLYSVRHGSRGMKSFAVL